MWARDYRLLRAARPKSSPRHAPAIREDFDKEWRESPGVPSFAASSQRVMTNVQPSTTHSPLPVLPSRSHHLRVPHPLQPHRKRWDDKRSSIPDPLPFAFLLPKTPQPPFAPSFAPSSLSVA